MVDEVVRVSGRLDVLINNAALDPKFEPQDFNRKLISAFETYPLNAWQELLECQSDWYVPGGTSSCDLHD